MSNNVNCPYCKKNRPHAHKGCNEVGTMRITIGIKKTPPKKTTKNKGKKP